MQKASLLLSLVLSTLGILGSVKSKLQSMWDKRLLKSSNPPEDVQRRRRILGEAILTKGGRRRLSTKLEEIELGSTGNSLASENPLMKAESDASKMRKSSWKEKYSSEHQAKYYVNTDTGVSQWESFIYTVRIHRGRPHRFLL